MVFSFAFDLDPTTSYSSYVVDNRRSELDHDTLVGDWTLTGGDC